MISIIMPVKNPGKYLIPCLDSIITQSYTNWELIMVNDGCTDGSDKTLENYASCYSNIQHLFSKGEGIVAALQTGYLQSCGEYIHRMDADDVMPYDKLERMVGVMDDNCIVTGMVDYFSDDFDLGDGYQKYSAWINQLMVSGDLWKDIYKECPIPSSAWLIHRTHFERIGGFLSSRLPEDYDLAFRMYKSGILVKSIPQVIHHWRDSNLRTSRINSTYFPVNYMDLKVHHFLSIDRNDTKPLLVWGAGKKGKKVAKALIKKKIKFNWITDNPIKYGVNIFDIIIQPRSSIPLTPYQLILAISSPTDQEEISRVLDDTSLVSNKDYFWFC